MKSLDEFRAKFQDELEGLINGAYHESTARQLAGDGGKGDKDEAALWRALKERIRRSRGLLDRMYADLAETPASNGQKPATQTTGAKK